jgi:CRAL/TRIO domain
MLFRRRRSSVAASRSSGFPRRSSCPSVLESNTTRSPEKRVFVRAKSICSSSNLDRLHLERQQLSLSAPVKAAPVTEDPWSEENLKAAIDLWELDQKQIARLLDLKERLKDCAHHWKYNPHAILRFMTSPQGANAESLFRKMVQWRMENNIDKFLDEYKPPQILLDYNISTIMDQYDRDGDPIYFERGGMADDAGMLKRFTQDEIKEFVIWLRETITRGEWLQLYEQRQGRKVRDITIVYDLKGLNSSHVNPMVLKLFGECQKLSQDMYPAPIKRIIIIRAPAVFRYIWSVVKHVFPQATRDKMIFAGNNHTKELEKYIELENLPKCVYEHGKGTPTIGLPPKFEGGIIPDHVVRVPTSGGPTVTKPRSKTVMKLESFDPTEQDTQSESSFVGSHLFSM